MSSASFDDIHETTPPAPTEPDPPTMAWQDRLARDRGTLQNRALKNLLKQRKAYATKLFWILCIWLASIFAILIFQGLKLWAFYLSDQVLIALLTSTTVTVVGLFLVVVKFLFAGSSVNP